MVRGRPPENIHKEIEPRRTLGRPTGEYLHISKEVVTKKNRLLRKKQSEREHQKDNGGGKVVRGEWAGRVRCPGRISRGSKN